MMEGFADFAGGASYMVYGASDTMGDLTADLIGVCIISACVYWYLGEHTANDVASQVRIGKAAFEVSGDGDGLR